MFDVVEIYWRSGETLWHKGHIKLQKVTNDIWRYNGLLSFAYLGNPAFTRKIRQQGFVVCRRHYDTSNTWPTQSMSGKYSARNYRIASEHARKLESSWPVSITALRFELAHWKSWPEAKNLRFIVSSHEPFTNPVFILSFYFSIAFASSSSYFHSLYQPFPFTHILCLLWSHFLPCYSLKRIQSNPTASTEKTDRFHKDSLRVTANKPIIKRTPYKDIKDRLVGRNM